MAASKKRRRQESTPFAAIELRAANGRNAAVPAIATDAACVADRPTGVTDQIGEERPFEGAIDREQTFSASDLRGRALRRRLLDPLTEGA
jgi:hypothetical protein